MDLFFLKKTHHKPNPEESAEKIIARAHRKSEELLEEAVKEAKLIIDQTQSFRQELQKNLKDDVAYQAAQFAQGYQELLPEIKKYYQAGVDQQLQTFRNHLTDLIGEMKTDLKNQMDGLSSLLKDQTAQELTIVRQELSEYKKSRMEEIESQAKAAVKKITLEVLGKTISTIDHQELIIKALEKAKKEGVFDK